MFEVRVGNGTEFTSWFYDSFVEGYNQYLTIVKSARVLGTGFGYIEIRNRSDQAIQRTSFVRGQELLV